MTTSRTNGMLLLKTSETLRYCCALFFGACPSLLRFRAVGEGRAAPGSAPASTILPWRAGSAGLRPPSASLTHFAIRHMLHARRPSVQTALLILPFVWALSLFHGALRAQEIRAEVSRNPVAVGEVFRLTYKANFQLEDFRMPRLSDFTLAGGPYQSFSQSFVNGRISVSTSISYDLIPQKKGRYLFGAATARYEGRMVTSNVIEIEVVEGSSAPQSARPGHTTPQPETARPEESRDIFIQAIPSKTSVYPGEPFTLTVKIYTRLQTELKDVSMPRLKGAFIQEIPDAADRQFRLETLGNQRYYVAVLRKLVVVAQKPGPLNLGRAGAEVKYQVVERTGDFWQDFFSGGRLRVFEKNLESAPIVIQVKPFPEAGRPSSFNGAAGSLQFKAGLDAEKANTGDAVKLRLRVSGQGNIPLIDLPQASVPPSFEVFEPQTTDRVTAADNGLSGSREQEMVIIPRSPGTFKISVPEFSWFNYQSGRYEVSPAQELTLAVEGAQMAGGISPTGSGLVKKDISLIQDDIRYLKRGVWNTAAPSGHKLPWWPLALPFSAGLALFLLRPVVRRRQTSLDRLSGRRAARAALQMIKKAEEELRKGNQALVYDLCSRALYRFLHDRFGLPLHAADRQAINRVFEKQPEVGQNFLEILDRCEAARFAPVAPGFEADLLQRCRSLILNNA